MQLLLHLVEFSVVHVVLVVFLTVQNGVIGCEACQSVDVPVGIVALDVPVVEPQHAVGLKPRKQPVLYVLSGERLVAVRCQQALRCGEQGALAVALNAAALEHKILMVAHAGLEHSAGIQFAVDGVVELPFKLFAPPVELEIKQMYGHLCAVFLVGHKGNCTMVARPGIVGVDGNHMDVALFARRQIVVQQFCYFGRFWGNYNQVLVSHYAFGHFYKGVLYLREHRCPVGVHVGPGELYAALLLPFGRHTVIVIKL